MQNSESVIRSILGPCRPSVRPLAFAVDVMIDLLFEKGMHPDEIKVGTHIYPAVAAELHKKVEATARSVERLTNLCWEHGDKERMKEITSRSPVYREGPWETMIYLACYTHLGVPYFDAIKMFDGLLI